MWQKHKGSYHLLLNNAETMEDGRFAQTACIELLQVRHKDQVPYVIYDQKKCIVCNGVWHIVFTSVQDARTSLKNQDNIKVLRRAADLTRSITLKMALEAKVRKLEKAKA